MHNKRNNAIVDLLSFRRVCKLNLLKFYKLLFFQDKLNFSFFSSLAITYLYIFFFYSISLVSLNSFLLCNKYSDLPILSMSNSIKTFSNTLYLFCFKKFEKVSLITFKNLNTLSYTSFFFKKFVYFVRLRYAPLALSVSNKNLSKTFNCDQYYVFFYNKHNLFSNNYLALNKDYSAERSISIKLFNMLFLCSGLTKKKLLLSNYNLLLLKHYISKFSNTDSSLFNSLNDNKVVTKKFVFFEFFLKKFLEGMICNRIFLTFVRNDIDFILSNQYYLMFIKRVKKLQIFNKDINLVRELVEVLVITMYTYDVTCFKNWLIKVAEKIHFKLHKRLFYIIKIIISKYFNLYFKYFGCLGFCLRVQGKIGLGGSSKTRSFWIKSGQFSLTRKSLKIAYTSGHIRTYSGILGIEAIISYV